MLWLSSAGCALPFCAPAESAFEIPLVPCSTSLCPSVFFPTPYSSPSLSAPSCFPKTTLQYDGGKISNNNSVVAVVLLLSRIRLLATPSVQFSSVQFSRSVVSDSLQPQWTVARQPPLSFTISQHLLTFKSIESVMPSNHFILCCPLLLLPSTFLSIGVFSSKLALPIRWPKC